MYKITFLGQADPKSKRKRPKQIGSVTTNATDPLVALTEAREMLKKQKPEKQKEVTGVEIRALETGVLKWD